MPLIAMAQDQLDITGSITDNKGEPLIGVSINCERRERFRNYIKY